MDREEMLKREDEAWLQLVDAFTALPADRRTVEGVVPGWSTHDLLWHCAFWAGYASEVLGRLQHGEPEEVEDVSDDDVVSAGRAMSWDEVVSRAEQNHERARTALSVFADPPDEAVQWFTDDTFDHYKEHATQIRAFSGGADPG